MFYESRYKNELKYNRFIDGTKTRPSQTIRFIDRSYNKDEISIYISQDGDTLFSISENYYDDFTLWYLIADKNVNIVNPFYIPIGTEVIVPDI